ncbi:MAG: peptidylprolyl isomerase [Gammaproteobacteria bacterium]|nr:MAG: peptidylprolyl isomerase [Gammaproteobacteria bacterium]
MKIAPNTRVTLHYTLSNAQGEILESTEGREPISFVQGQEEMLPGLESALEGHEAGEQIELSLEAEDAFGAHDPDLVEEIPRQMFEGVEHIEPGMRFQTRLEDGIQIVTVTRVEEDVIEVDGNHPFAGQQVHIRAEIVSVEAAD